MRADPIRSTEKVQEILDALRQDRSPAGRRRYLLFASGIFLGRRVGDLLKMRVGDVLGKDRIDIREQKTKKMAYLAIPKKLQRIYREELTGRGAEEWVFQSRQRNRVSGLPEPVTRMTAYRDIKAIAKLAHLEGNFGTHTMRKTFGYTFYRTSHDLALLMELFNHSKEAVTLIYIGVTDEERVASAKVIDRMYDT